VANSSKTNVFPVSSTFQITPHHRQGMLSDGKGGGTIDLLIDVAFLVKKGK